MQCLPLGHRPHHQPWQLPVDKIFIISDKQNSKRASKTMVVQKKKKRDFRHPTFCHLSDKYQKKRARGISQNLNSHCIIYHHLIRFYGSDKVVLSVKLTFA
jgi:hypothetical protein